MRAGPLLLGAAVLGGAGSLAYAMLSKPKAPGVEATIELSPARQASAPISDGSLPSVSPDVDPGPQVTAQPPMGSGEPVRVCNGEPTPAGVSADGRLFGHFRYEQPSAVDLIAPPASFGSPNCQQIHKDMATSLRSMMAAAAKDDPAVGKAMMGVSCYRSIERQRGLFCNPAKLAERGYDGQAKWVAPPNYSEHATGLTIDFGARSVPQCHTNPCFKSTRTSQWLAANAGKYGFEISFPENNAQGVNYEPWHYRWVGSDTAKSVFAKARAAFPSH